jgi:hypothetical protein
MAEKWPKWFPVSAYLASYQIDSSEELDSSIILKKLYDGYGGEYSEEFHSMEFRSGSVLAHVRLLTEEDAHCFLVVVGSMKASDGFLDANLTTSYSKRTGDLKEVLPDNPDSSTEIRFAYVSLQDEAVVNRDALKVTDLELRSVGERGNCLLATLKDMSPTFNHTDKFVVIIHGNKVLGQSEAAWDLCFEMGSLTIIRGKINHLYLGRQLMLEQMDASESSTQMGINEVLARMRKPVDEVKPSDLEDSLKEITIQFSRISTLTNSMRRDQIKAKVQIRNVNKLLKSWNEKAFLGFLTNSTVILDDLEDIIAPLNDFIERTEALTAQFSTVLDSVRTYLGIQQQKLSLTEQTSSREQLVQLVNLQETLHKLEILVVAFYLTEVARIVFEVILSESANLLTVLFIPIALLASLLISRMLSKKH